MDFHFVDKILPFLKNTKSAEELNNITIFQFYIKRFGIGKTISFLLILFTAVHLNVKVNKYFPSAVNKEIKYIFIENFDYLDLMLETSMKKTIQKDVLLYTYRGDRHLLKLPLHGQRRRANSKTIKKMKILVNI